MAAAERPAAAVGVSSVQKDDYSSAGEGLKCQTEVGALGKGDPPKASERGWNLAKPGLGRLAWWWRRQGNLAISQMLV